jgi:ketosteroid isomerase-like protein
MSAIHVRLACAVLLGASASSLAQAPPAAHAQHATPAAAPVTDIAPEAKGAVAVVEAFGKALAVGDLKTAGNLLASDVLILETGGAERSREEYLGHHAISDAAFLKGTHSQLTHRRARVHGDLAWVGSESQLHAAKDGKPVTLLSTETMVLKRAGADWRIVHIHWSSRPKR